MTKRLICIACAAAAVCAVIGSAVFVDQKALGTDIEITQYTYNETADTPKSSTAENPLGASSSAVYFKANKGDSVIVTCKIGGASKVLGIQETLSFDTSALSYVNNTLKINNKNYDFAINKSKSGEISWSEMFASNGSDFSNETEIVTFTFKAEKNISQSDEVVSISVEQLFNDKTEDLSKDLVKHSAEAAGTESEKTPEDKTEKTTILYGDVNSDEKIDSMDSLLILRESVGLENFNDVQKIAANVDGDDSITSGDALIVLRYYVGLTDKNVLVGQTKTFE